VGDVAPVPFAAAAQSYVDAWKTLPASVRRVVVIRDTPTARPDVLSCVSRAARRHERPGPACAQPLILTLAPDPAVAAVQQERSVRFQSVDLTDFFCDRENCFPVVGGVLVYLDQNHLTPLFVSTLAPYLRRAVDRLK
jgi:SGNH domain (fused to AT3 domains)